MYQLIGPRTFLELGQSDKPSPRTFDATDTLSKIALRKNHALKSQPTVLFAHKFFLRKSGIMELFTA